ncbi:hypothetical protein MCEL_28910 [Mycolicibacterium celeriflavum]|uniref:Uncharacterized protein n=1 Tax=Mycolicibacterium celeriflavum TaxID=1249101 RepID=A0A7I7RKJ5_MYCCF|nr:hypothetical protein MCEL_28910 [Mycolicibacterium celeriflavum]
MAMKHPPSLKQIYVARYAAALNKALNPMLSTATALVIGAKPTCVAGPLGDAPLGDFAALGAAPMIEGNEPLS